jgi:cation diffusion facilitator family transporter
LTLILISGWIVFEAVMRFRNPEQVEGGLMLAVASVGLVVNVIAARVLHPTSHGNMNVRGAYLHVLGDLLAGVGTLSLRCLIRYTGWLIADPLVSVLTAALIVRGSWQLVRESVDILLESTPPHIDLEAVRRTARGNSRNRVRARPSRLGGDAADGSDECSRNLSRFGRPATRIGARARRDAAVRNPACHGSDRAE